jgi:predicted DNA-binding transcriptional regulator AlpA
MHQNRIIRMADIASTPVKRGMLPVSPATIWRWIGVGKFPAPFKIGCITAWYADEIDAFIAQCAGRAAD